MAVEQYPFERVIERLGQFNMDRVSFEEYQKEHPFTNNGRTFISYLTSKGIEFQVKDRKIVLTKSDDL